MYFYHRLGTAFCKRALWQSVALYTFFAEYESDDKDLSPSAKREKEKRQKEITDTYNKVAEFLQQNKNLRQSITSMNELSKELYTKKENLTQLISNIKENMQSKYSK